MKRKVLTALMMVFTMSLLAGCEVGSQAPDANSVEEGNSEATTNVEAAIKELQAENSNAGEISEESLIGMYEDTVSQRAGAEIVSNGDGTLNIRVSWGSSAFETSVWTMNAKLDSTSNRLIYSDEKSTIETYSDDGSCTEEVQYEGKEGYFEIDNGNLKWTGAADDSCKECVFAKYDVPVWGDGEDGFMSNSFVETREKKDVFSSYDEIIAALMDGEGYAYLELEGYDGKLLGITEGTFDNLDGNLAAIDISIYADNNGKVTNIGNAYSQGTAYPIRCEDGILYVGGHHEYQELFVCKETGGLMIKKLVSEDFDENNEPFYYGFERDSNSQDAPDKDITITNQDDFYKLFEDIDNKTIVNFVVIGK